MNNNHWNEVVSAYDQNFINLEAARQEYGEFSKITLESLKSSLLDKLEGSIDPQNAKLDIQIVPSPNLGKNVLKIGLVVDDVEWTRVNIRISSPWGGPSEKLHAGIELPPNDHLLPFSETILLIFLKEDLLGPGEGIADIGQYPFLIEGRFFQLSNIAESWPEIPDDIIKLTQVAAKTASTLGVNARPIIRGREALLLSRDAIDSNRLSQNHTLSKGRKFHGPWYGLHYVQLNLEEAQKSIWVGIHPEKREIIYVHNDLQKEKNEHFAGLVQCDLIEHGNHPAGMVVNEADLTNNNIEKLTSRVEGIYREFAKYVSS